MQKQWKKLRQFNFQIIFVLALSAIYLIGNSRLVLAQSKKENNSSNQNINISFEPPNRGTPKSKDGTGSRGNCLYKPALPPLKSLGGKSDLKLTASDRPTIWVYIPYSKIEASYGEFSLQQGDNEIYRTRFQLMAKPGVMGIELPSSISPLKVGTSYRWYLDINCSTTEDNFSTPTSLTGVVKKIALATNLTHELETRSNSLNQVAIYAQNGIWYDAVNKLAQLRLQNPENLTFKQAWIKLLSDRDVNLKEIASESILGNVEIIELQK